jgi:hypothetical protein
MTREGSTVVRWAAARALPRRTRPSTRRYLRPGLSLDDFFDELNRLGVRYAVLRWFDSLPDVEPGEDIDLLVADDDLDLVGTMLRSHRTPPRRQKFDVYTVSGLPGSDFQGIPYLSPALARGVLDRAVLLRGRYRVPSPVDHFDSMAYHAVYHKGERSMLPTSGAVRPASAGAEHDYTSVLTRLAEECSLAVEVTMEGLDRYLEDKGLRPPLDTLDKLGAANPWLQQRIEDRYGPAHAGNPGLAVFVLRAQAADRLDRLTTELLREGWQPLEVLPLDAPLAARVAAGVRGGNWGRGPWPVDGGGPAAYVVAYDLAAAVDAGQRASDPERVMASKLAIRRRLLRELPDSASFNPLHSSDDPRQALDYLSLLGDPGVLARARDEIERIRSAMVFPFPVVELLPSRRRRAVTAVVEHPQFGECVCKLFYPSAARFLERELRARTDFAALPEVPPLLAAGANWLLSPRYVDTRAHVRRRLPGMRHVQLTPEASHALAELARALHEKGAFLLDLTPFNLLSDRRHGLKVVDWEFLQDFPGAVPPLAASPTVLGHAGDLPGMDTPLGVSTMGEPAVTVFSPLVSGLPARLRLRGGAGPMPAAAESGMVLAFLVRGARTMARSIARQARREGRRSAARLLNGASRLGHGISGRMR